MTATKITRRTFVRRVIGTGAMLATGGVVYPYLIEPWRVAVNHIPIRIPELPAALNGLTIAHLTDLHRSRYVSSAYLHDCVTRANALNPDLIVFTGDYLTEGRTQRGLLMYGDRQDAATYVKDCAACIGQARARYGVFATLGNHDHWFDADAVTREIEAADVPVLRNRPALVKINGETLPIFGLGDLWTEGVNFSQSFAGVDRSYAIVLMHNPDAFEHWPQPGHHLVLAGHTHGGQVNIPFYGPPLVPSQYGRKYAQGLHRHGTAQMYVNRGLGLIFPAIRFNCRPEIAVLHLQRA